MATTTLKLPEALKRRVSAIVDGTGKSPHAFMVEAIEQQAALAERRKAFVASAVAAREQAELSGKGYLLEDVRKEYAARLAGKPARRARQKRWRK